MSNYIGIGQCNNEEVIVTSDDGINWERQLVGTPGLAYNLINNNTEYGVSKGTVTGGDVIIPSTYNGLPVTYIGNEAFYNCTGLTSITIPAGVTSIGESAFGSCTSLTSINIPEGVTSIGNNAFYNCTSLTSINIPEGVTSIGGQAFSFCTSLTSITIPESVTSIGSNAFFGWTFSQTIYIEGYASQAAADAAWGSIWRNSCNAVINYNG